MPQTFIGQRHCREIGPSFPFNYYMEKTRLAFNPPAEGKSVVFFVCVADLMPAKAFLFFDNDKFIAEFTGKKYIRHECQPGGHLFWTSSENEEFLTAELKANECYLVNVDVQLAAGRSWVRLLPIMRNHEIFEKAKTLLNNEGPHATPQETIDKENIKLTDFIKEKVQEYHDREKHQKSDNHLSADMAIPVKSGNGVVVGPNGQWLEN
jgi:hypothetical protein